MHEHTDPDRHRSAAGPLSGRTIVVTRASDQAGSFSAMLRDAGATVIEIPLITIVDAPDGGAALRVALARLDSYDWLVVTSPNGAARVRDALIDRVPGSPSIAAIGTATSAALSPRTADLIPPRQIAESLVEVFPVGSGRVLLVQGLQARGVLMDGLTAKGRHVERVTAYATVPRPIEPSMAAALSGADAITFLSGSAATSFAVANRTIGVDLPLQVVSIGPATTEVARSAGISVTVTAHVHTLRGTLETLVRIFV